MTDIAFFAASVAIPVIHLGIGLSLALGRWVRDLPKGKPDSEQPAS